MKAQRGMTLLEVLVAVSIMAMSLAVLYRISGGSVRAVMGADAAVRAQLQAESILASRDAVPLQGWSEQGETAGLRWTVQSFPLAPSPDVQRIPPLYRVEVEVHWRGPLSEQQVRLVSVLPGAKKDPAEGGR